MRRTFVSSTKDGSLKEKNASAFVKDRRQRNKSLFSSSESSSEDDDDGNITDGETNRIDEGDENASAVAANHRSGSLFPSSREGNSNPQPQQQRSASLTIKANRPAASPPRLSPSNRGDDLRRTVGGSSRPSSFSSSSGTGPAVGGNGNERKGLFEGDDETDSLENFHASVKLRQIKKKSEIDSLKLELESAQKKIEALATQVTLEVKEKDEYAIRMKECQRIIEKRNKQLLKTSERVARYTEQSESKITELETKIAELTEQSTQLREDAGTKAKLIREMETKYVEQQQHYEKKLMEQQQIFEKKLAEQKKHTDMQLQHVMQISEESLRAKQSEIATLEKNVAQLEDEVSRASSRVVETDVYQALLKKYEDAEAISRGLKYQLLKEQHEKRFLKKKQSLGNGPSDSLFGENLESKMDISPSSSVASGDLSSFDFSADQHPAPSSPTSTRVVTSPARKLFGKHNRVDVVGDEEKPDGQSKIDADEEFTARSSEPNDEKFTSGVDEERPTPARTTSGSTNFFEKISIKFKRQSPRNSYFKNDEAAAPTVSAPSVSKQKSPAYGKVLKERPRMYVAKSPSNHEEESSDSIFGSESESSLSSSESEDDSPPLPPAPPQEYPKVVPSQSIPQAEQRSFSSDDSDDADLSDSSDSEDNSEINATAAMDPPAPPSPTPFISIEHDSSEDSDEPEEVNVKKDNDVQESSRTAKVPDAANAVGDKEPSSSSSSSDDDNKREHREKTHKRRHKRHSDDDRRAKRSSRSSSLPRNREKSHSTGDDIENNSHTAKSRMNEYMEARAKKRIEKLKKKEEKANEEHKKREEYEKEWEKMAQEERERKKKQQVARRSGRRRPSSMKTVRVSQMRQQMNKQQQQKEQQQQDQQRTRGEDGVDDDRQRRHSRRKSDGRTSDSDDDEEDEQRPFFQAAPSDDVPPPPPQPPSELDNELYLRQQARLREHHENEMKKKMEAEEADLVRGQIHHRVEMWAYGKELLHMILTLDQISTNDALQKCQLMVVQSPDNDTVRKAYRNIIRVIHPDKLRGATVAEQLEAKELFTVINQAFERFKNQAN